MSEEFIPKAGSIKIGGLGPKAAKLQALREKVERIERSVSSRDANGAPKELSRHSDIL